MLLMRKAILRGRRLSYALAAGFLLVCALQVASLAVLFISQEKQTAAWRLQREEVDTAMDLHRTLERQFQDTRTAWREYLETGSPELREKFQKTYEQLSLHLISARNAIGQIGPAPAASLEEATGEVQKYYQEFLLPRLQRKVPLPQDEVKRAEEASLRAMQGVTRAFYKLNSNLAAEDSSLTSNIDHLAAVKLVGVTSLVLVALAITGYVGWLSLRAARFFRLAEDERKVAERQAKFFKVVLDQLPAGISVRSAPDGGTVMVNRAARQYMGLAKIPQSVTQVTTEGVLHPDGAPYRTPELPMIRSLTRGETVNAEEMILEFVGGGRTTVLCSSKPILDDERNITAAITIYQDISDRKKLESSLEAKTHELDQLVREQQQQIIRLTQMQEISAKVSAQKSAQDICREVLPAVAEMLAVEKCYLQLADPGMRELKVAGSAHGISPKELAQIPHLSIMWDDSPLMQAFWADKPLVLNDVQRDPGAEPYQAIFSQLGARSAVYLRLAAHGKPAGLLAVFDRRDRKPFNEQDVQLLRILASHIAIALENARLYESLRERSDQLATLLQEAHHRIKNNLAMVTSLLSLEMSYGLDKSSAQICASTIGRIESIARVHALLTQDSTHGVPVRPLIEQLVQSLASTSLNPHQRIHVDYSIAPMHLPSREATALALVTTELLSNALRHGFVGRDEGAVHVRFQKSGESEAVLVVSNDGNPLMGDLSQPRHGLGLRIVEALARRDLKGNFTVSRDNGQTVATVRFHLPARVLEHPPDISLA